MPKHSVICAFDLRNVFIAAVKDSGTKTHVKIFYPYNNGSQIDVHYTDEVYFKYFSIVLNEKLKTLAPEAQIKNKRFDDCVFFCCDNCLTVGLHNKNKLITNYCNKCAAVAIEKNLEECNKRDAIRIEREALQMKRFEAMQPKEEPKMFSEFLQKEEIKKRVSPIKLKFKK